MAFSLKNIGRNIVSAATGAAKALDPTSGQSLADRGGALFRGTTALATGGLSEAGREGLRAGGEMLSKLDPTRPADVTQIDPNAVANVQSAQLGLASRLGAGPQVQAAQIGAVGAPQAATIDQAQQAQARGMQMDVGGMLRAQALGQAPSAAQLQALQGGEDAARRLMGAAAAGGYNPAAMRGAQFAGAQAMAQATGQAAQLRAQEIAQAQQALGTLAGQVRAGDIGLATSQADLAQQANLLAAQQAQDRAIQQAQLTQQAGLTGAQLAQQRDIANQDAINQFLLQQAQMQQQAALANQATQLGIQQANVGALNQAQLQAVQGRNALLGGLLQAGADVGAAAVTGPAAPSDKRIKKNIVAGEKEAQEFLDGLESKSFAYKGKNKKMLGVLAQDMERTSLGNRAIVNTDGGTKMIDENSSIGPVLASLAQINKRLKAIEKAGQKSTRRA